MKDPESKIKKSLQKEVTRRRFLKTGVVAGLSLGGAGLLGNACSQQSANPTSVPSTAPAAKPTSVTSAASGTTPAVGATPTIITRAAPKGKVVFAIDALAGEPIDAHFERSGTERPITRELYEGLVIGSPEGKMVPGLAESWTATAEGWTFNLRKGVKFHSGNAFTADDVKFSWDRITNPEIKHPQGQQLAGIIDRVDVLDANKIFFHTPAPYAGLLNLAMWFLIIDSKQFQKVGADAFGSTDPSGTGPFRFLKRTKGQFVDFEAFEQHWATVPKVKNVTMRLIPEAATRLAALKTGEVDIAVLNAPQFAEVKGDSSLKTVTTPETGWQSICFFDLHHPDASPMKDLNIRKAMTYGLNYPLISDKVFYGLYKAGGSPLLPNAYGANTSLPRFNYDLDMAKKLMAESAFPKGFETTIEAPVGTENVVQAMVGDWDKLGIRVKIIMEETATMYAKWRDHSLKGIGYLGGGAYFDGLFYAVTFLIPNSPWGYVSDSKLTDTYNTMAKEMDDKKREKLIQDFDKYSYDNFYRPAIFWYDTAAGYGSRVAEYKPFKAGQTSQAFETIVLKG